MRATQMPKHSAHVSARVLKGRDTDKLMLAGAERMHAPDATARRAACLLG